MNDLNQCQFIGRAGKEPEMRSLTNGDSVANFSIAVGWKTKDKEGVEWVRCTAFGKLADIIGRYVVKGKQIYISGRMQTRKYQNKEGQDVYTTEVIAENMQLLGGRDDGDAQTPRKSRQASSTVTGPGDDGECPF